MMSGHYKVTKHMQKLTTLLISVAHRYMTDRQTDRQTDKHSDKQTDKQIDKQTDKQTEKRIEKIGSGMRSR